MHVLPKDAIYSMCFFTPTEFVMSRVECFWPSKHGRVKGGSHLAVVEGG